MKNLGLFISVVFLLGSILLSYCGFKNGNIFLVLSGILGVVVFLTSIVKLVRKYDYEN
ncbi:Uncharacterised protein [Streptococcus gallolyticus]|uniref:Uncharacterized protein n=2 Tax=Streptococcus gallolyticus TaxID=315405 RepID=A0AA94M0I9_9STRE|nr:Uncharacterised protein [Streptococcus gallolyticus]